MKFIQINNQIFDYYKYNRELFLVKSHLLISIYDLAQEHGFTRENDFLINKNLNCKIRIVFEKLEPEVFV